MFFERPTLRGCQCRCALDRVKALRPLTLPCQRTNPDGVICGGIGWGWDGGVDVCEYAYERLGFCGVICGRAVAETRGQGSHLGIRAFHIRFRWLIRGRCVAGRTLEAL